MKISQFCSLNFLFYAYLGFLLAGCATPRPILRMKPIQENQFSQQIFWQNGTPFIQSITDSIGVRVGFGFFDERQNLMHINCEFINFSNNAILIAPEKFYYKGFDSIQRVPMFEQGISWAIDPEKKILDLEKGIARKEASAKNSKGWAVAGAVVAVTAVAVVAASQTKSNTNNDVAKNKNNNVANGAALVGVTSALASTVTNNNSVIKRWEIADDRHLKENWENLTLRKTHLFPQESIKGSILFPVKDSKIALKYLRFYFPIEKTIQDFAFKQKWINSEILPNSNNLQKDDF